MAGNNTINTRIQHKHDIEANWNRATNFIPLIGEIIIYDIDDKFTCERFKIGDGKTYVVDLPFYLEDEIESIWNIVEAIPEIPNVTTQDNGKFLRVVDGIWAAASIPNAEEAEF